MRALFVAAGLSLLPLVAQAAQFTFCESRHPYSFGSADRWSISECYTVADQGQNFCPSDWAHTLGIDRTTYSGGLENALQPNAYFPSLAACEKAFADALPPDRFGQKITARVGDVVTYTFQWSVWSAIKDGRFTFALAAAE